MAMRVATCSCGGLGIELGGELLGVGLCHCLACQRRTGSAFATLARFAPPFRIVGQAREFTRVGDHGAQFVFSFCPVCGTNLFHREVGGDASIAVAVGGFADPEFPPPTVATYDVRRHAWVVVLPGVESFGYDPE